MQYIFLSIDAIQELTSIHHLQSAEFSESTELCEVLRGEKEQWVFRNIIFKKTDKGGFFYTINPHIQKGLIFDLATFKGFDNPKNDQLITIFQKVLKFAIRSFEKLPFTACEKQIAGTNTYLVFPFPFVATKDQYKVVIERDAANKRFEKRDRQYLLVYATATNEIVKGNASFTNLNKAVEEAAKICVKKSLLNNNDGNQPEQISSLMLTTLDLEKDLSINSTVGFDQWQHYLTINQKEFISKAVAGPERLEGAAGTGKTLTMILRCINLLKLNSQQNNGFHILFITHSLSTKNQILDIFRANFGDLEFFLDKSHSSISITITTLQEWCINFLGTNLGTTEYLDKDAQDSKLLQKMYLEQSFDKAMSEDFESYKLFCSNEFIEFIEKTSKEDLLEMLQHEIAVTIKGRANEDLEKYKKLQRLKYSIPCNKEGDITFLFLIYNYYQNCLKLTKQFDSDDIILTALGQLNTPIWRRRKEQEGFHVSFVDETHLFNLNELSIFHHLNIENNKKNIVFTIDKSQAVGDRGLVDETLFHALGFENLDNKSSAKLNTIFRSSPDIVNLAFNVLSSGATLFTNFENPMDKASFNFTEQEEKKARIPRYILKENDEVLISETFNEADSLVKSLATSKSKILIIATTELLLNQLEQYAKKINKPIEVLKSRGDLETVKSASKSNRFIIAGIDYVGGLEFDGVIIVGVDKGRVPPNGADSSEESNHFLNYSWHNRIYVALTRAKYALILLGHKSRGQSSLFQSSIENGILVIEDKN